MIHARTIETSPRRGNCVPGAFWEVRYPARARRSGRVAEGGALLRRYGGECSHRGFESLLLRSPSAAPTSSLHGGNQVSPVCPLLKSVRVSVGCRAARERGLARRDRQWAGYHAASHSEGWQSGRMRRSRKPLSVVRRIEGSNPSPSARIGRWPRGGCIARLSRYGSAWGHARVLGYARRFLRASCLFLRTYWMTRGGRSLGRPAGGDPTSPASRPWELRPRYPRILASLGRASLDRGTIVRKVRLTLESDGRKLEERDKRREKRWGTGHPSGFDERSPYGHLRAPGTGLRRWTGSGR